MKKTRRDYENKAKIIAAMINKTDTDFRGNLLREIGFNLKSRSQYYIGNLFLEIADKYGYAPKEDQS